MVSRFQISPGYMSSVKLKTGARTQFPAGGGEFNINTIIIIIIPADVLQFWMVRDVLLVHSYLLSRSEQKQEQQFHPRSPHPQQVFNYDQLRAESRTQQLNCVSVTVCVSGRLLLLNAVDQRRPSQGSFKWWVVTGMESTKKGFCGRMI